MNSTSAKISSAKTKIHNLQRVEKTNLQRVIVYLFEKPVFQKSTRTLFQSGVHFPGAAT